MEGNDELQENEDQEQDNFEDFGEEDASRDLVAPGEILTEDTKNFLPGRGTIFNKEKSKIISLNIGLKQIWKNMRVWRDDYFPNECKKCSLFDPSNL